MKAKSRKQIKNSLKNVDVLKNNFKKAVIDTFGETEGIKMESCFVTENISGLGECPVYIVFDEKDDGYNKTFKFATIDYEKNSKTFRKVVQILEL